MNSQQERGVVGRKICAGCKIRSMQSASGIRRRVSESEDPMTNSHDSQTDATEDRLRWNGRRRTKRQKKPRQRNTKKFQERLNG